MGSPYEIYNNTIGVKGNFLFTTNNNKKADVNSLCIVSYDTLNYKLKTNQIIKLRPQGPGSPMLVKYDSLPYQWQKLLIQSFGEPSKQITKSLFEKFFQRDTQAWEFYIAYKKANGIGLDDNLIERYTLNASVLNTISKLNKAMCDQRKSLRGSTGNIMVHGIKQPSVWEVVVAEANRYRSIQAHTLPDHGDNIRKLLNRYKKEGYSALVSGKIDNSNARIVKIYVIKLLNNLFAGQSHKPSYADVTRLYDSFINGYTEVINNDTGELYSPKDFPKLSKATINNYLSQWENKIGNENIRSNNRQRLIGKFRPYHSFDKPKYAGSIISVDDRQPPFYYAPGKRMWFYMGIDLASEAWTCWVHGESKEGIILDFYRQMVRNYAEWGYNLPAELEGEISLNSSYTGTFLKEGSMFQYTHLEANNARGKMVERFFGKLRYQSEKEKDGWIARPHAKSEANQADELKPVIIPVKTIIQQSLKDIEEWNNQPHSSIEGKTRWEVFTERQNPNTHPTNYRSILPHLGYATKTSCRAGIIQLNNQEFLLGEDGKVSSGKRLIQLMTEVEGCNIIIYWIDDNEGKVLKAHIYTGSQYICEAVAKPKYQKARIEQTPEDFAAREIMSSYVATIDLFMKDRKSDVEEVIVIKNTLPTITNNLFKINGLKRVVEKENETEFLPEPDDELEVIVEDSFKSRLKDRF
jgi:hypothetical protein